MPIDLILIRIQKLLHALTSLSGMRALKHGVAASIEHRDALGDVEYKTVIDVGANVGQFALFAREQYPAADIFSFEPLDDCWSIFSDIFSSDKHVQLFRCGIGPKDTQATLNVTNQNDSSSLLTPAAMQTEAFGTEVKARRNVEMRRLGSALRREQIAAPALLKIDVQGFELSVLQGCEELLGHFDTIYLEASFRELYQGQALVGDVIEHLRGRGFELRGVFNQNMSGAKGPLQADFLFKQAHFVNA
ncbi:FkbM family methyltransferase [Bradyrhizobium sp. LVM 105]|uniref:FkbM family methyltransferase n=1 Tax=Bradyrhizobium sp. LVM 105 TaxID=2341115 RepID=UPI000F80852A|nr:FkbM family methyltransferase [Bradyrhizobium sp. LVM 105]RTE87996.1 FkbM family methyltransferase [Bradyrhizobium sp. LVM 105]